ncbi:sugar transferase [Paenibacillus tianjinensis]|uniref:Sugar transferase n=1 Tax=Paenibacillus tianjinensis TaxID=2810347 RepID=A0ABX7LA01_9BACL|nr:sugar transferase [Paenibacillus tianjinensis]QSF44116.1 sugar transferase [Paenibacillus tianjinensis]
MKRIVDITFSLIGLILLSPFIVIIAIAIRLDSPGPVMFKQKRIGMGNSLFTIYKFRSMKIGTPDIPTDRINPADYVTAIGKFLRKTSLDEIPQLFNVFLGEMSFVGPRPALHNQNELIKSRTEKGIHHILPGITGWAQINGRDEIDTAEKVSLDEYYLKNWSIKLDFKILYLTCSYVFKAKGIKA